MDISRGSRNAMYCYPIWDSTRANFSPCVIPALASIPITVILLAAVMYLLDHPFFQRWRPAWTLPFVSEQKDLAEVPRSRPTMPPAKTIALFVLSALAFACEVAELIMLRRPDLTPILYTIAWGIAVLLILVKRPRSSPILLLAFFVSTWITELLLFRSSKWVGWEVNLHQCTVAVAVAACLIILIMPLRDSLLPSDGISPVGRVPSEDERSPEDELLLWQFLTVSWMAPLISVGRKRTIDESDIWSLGFDFQHQRLHEKFRQLKGSVLGRLLQANGIDVVIISTIALVQLLCSFSMPVLLQQLLQVMSDRRASKNVAMIYAAMMLVLGLVSAQSQVLILWYGRRSYERSRGEMIMMVYEKALSRKNVFEQRMQSKQETTTEDLPEHPHTDSDAESSSRKSRQWCGLMPGRGNKRQEESKETASMGKIFNLLRGDVYEVAQRFWEIDTLIDKPLGLVISIVLVWQLFGPSCFLGVVTVLVAQVINAFITRTLFRWERIRRKATDTRLQITSQFVEALRHLRWYGWQDHWINQVMESRDKELHLRVITSLWMIMISSVNAFASGAFPVVALYAYTMLAGHPLRIDIIFPALQLFAMLETRLRDIPNLITVLINASIAMGRIEDFMAEPDKESDRPESSSSSFGIKLESCAFAWPGRLSPVLSDLTLTIPQGLTVVCGKVGSGKTALLQALLGELDKLRGESHIPTEMVGYCAQTPWLQSMSIRDNILFSAPYNEQRYKKVLDACALLPDLANFKHGDLSFVGENGIGLSGGQKARVAFARAMYSTARILFLDDPLSALDHNTAEYVVRRCLQGPLVQDRIVVLVTHRTTLVQPIADQLIEIKDGYAKVYDKQSISSVDAIDDDDVTANSEDEEAESEEVSAAVPDKFIEDEHRAEWGVQARVYWTYIKAGKLKWWAALVGLITIYRLTDVGRSWFLKGWGEAYEQVLLIAKHIGVTQKMSGEWIMLPPLTGMHVMSANFTATGLFDRIEIPAPTEDVRPWLWTFFAITTLQSLTLLGAQLLMLIIVYCAGKSLFREVMVKVSKATFRFFDVTPVGRLMNRLTADIGTVDGNISNQFQLMAFQAITWVTSIVVIGSVTPTFLVFSFVLTVSFILVFIRFLPLSQSLRRLEMVSLSPLMSNFGELLNGLTTVRAFHAEVRFQDRVIRVVDKFQGMDHFYWSLQSWLMYRFEGLSALSTFCLTALALYTDISPGLVAFVLLAANAFVQSTHALCKQYGQLQMDFVSVERIDELRHVEQEPEGDIDPPAYWPRFGTPVIFEDVTVRYAPHLDPSLTNVSLEIPGGSTAAVIGRTGSGKSTLALCLLGVIQPEKGQILIDNIDIARVNRQALRTRVTFVAQDPILFPGSIRLNLDPTDQYSDEECADVLKRICSRHGWTLDFHIEAGGRNLSQGQRQLIGLTRAALRRSPIVILDEATASIDHETSLEIQKIIREEMRESTVITIAHRLEAINEADYYVVLDRGQVTRQGHVDGSQNSI